ncbi:flippase-like domain-containing protein [Methylobacterium sp. NI91]|nr:MULTISPECIES: HpnL family protein [unclassified Methylobacterium]QIJ75971.1 flippase-like domain-containing protein [Methylobacterium sp. CLZ]QIJ80873.1 flippase-like domain-containing protein [Methylobacterium sp. NI91]
MKRLTTLASIVGLGTALALFLSSGVSDVTAAVVSAGWGTLAVVLARFAAVAWAGFGWHTVFPRGAGPTLRDCISLRFVREGINTLLPVAQVGGDFIGARLLTRRGTPGGMAGASMFVDLMTQAVTQLVFTIAGLLLLMQITGDGPLVRTVAGGVLLAIPALAAFYVIQRRSGHRLIEAALSRFTAGREWRALGAIDVLYQNLRRLYGNRARVGAALLIHLVGWVVGTVEVWIALNAMGYSISFVDALVIESLAQAVRGAAFVVPGAIGAQEGGLIALGALFGIPPEAALALSLVKRVADLAVGLPSLALWNLMERKTAVSTEPAGADAVREGLGAIRARLGRRLAPAPLAPAYGFPAARNPATLSPDNEAGALQKCA